MLESSQCFTGDVKQELTCGQLHSSNVSSFISSLKSNNNKYIRGVSGSEHSLAYSQARMQDKQRQITEAGIKQPMSQTCTKLKNLNQKSGVSYTDGGES